jgi:hypothetical protein
MIESYICSSSNLRLSWKVCERKINIVYEMKTNYGSYELFGVVFYC